MLGFMNIGIIGATGTIGSRIFKEASLRGHKVTAIARDASRIPADQGGAAWKVADALDPNSLVQVIGGQDAVICAFSQGKGGDPQRLVQVAHSLLDAFGRRGALDRMPAFSSSFSLSSRFRASVANIGASRTCGGPRPESS